MANNFIVFRMNKHKSATAMRSSLKHAMRVIRTPNANPDLRAANCFWETQDGRVLGGKTVEQCMELYNSKLPDNVRKNNVHCIEYVVSGSPEHMATLSREQQQQFFFDAVKFLSGKTGGMNNILHAQIHYDETTPHLTLFMMPLDEKGKLNARKFIGGKKGVLREFQTEIAKEVGAKYGFARGIMKEKPDNHITVKEFYKILNSFKKLIERKEKDPVLLGSDIDSVSRDIANLIRSKDLIKDKAAIQARIESTLAKIAKPELREHDEENRLWGIVSELRNELQYIPEDKLLEHFLEQREEFLQRCKDEGAINFTGYGKPENILRVVIDYITEKLKQAAKNREEENAYRKQRERDEIEYERSILEAERKNLEESKSDIRSKLTAEAEASVQSTIDFYRKRAVDFEVKLQLLSPNKFTELQNKNQELEAQKSSLKNENEELKLKVESKNNELSELRTRLARFNDPQYIKQLHEQNEQERMNKNLNTARPRM